MIKILHIITGLNIGGAELMLYRIISHHNNEKIIHSVISLTSLGVVGLKMQKEGIDVQSIEMGPKELNPKYLFKLISLIKKKTQV